MCAAGRVFDQVYVSTSIDLVFDTPETVELLQRARLVRYILFYSKLSKLLCVTWCGS